ncbi:zinc-dependent alcohol dehydrogenase family protein [Echinicola jeungdonensis]|uniref:Zinc-dependent alcohol dehydrogenase family protein n=2 Tax=Echinicola jeungdonensis TaxID=709343 RepID=A0ABV5J5Y0_9BACT|nr:zinc-dependent alcohol dehydrogenase family protein [Echinicola jeungdonensis]MDN3668098.1 zinc-dependent alcohol dehydrogenase family protein [Echinicola jeungdonensis]
MKAMVLHKIVNLSDQSHPLELRDIPKPVPKADEVLIRVNVCGVCHTELDEIEGRTPPPKLPVVLGHQAVGYVEKVGGEVTKVKVGDRVGVAWIFSACGKCQFCRSGQENLCDQFQATGRDVNGGYADFMTAKERFVHPIPTFFSDAAAAPLLCAGAIGYRSMVLTGLNNGQNLGLTGFGASAHLVLKMIRYRYPNSKVFIFARSKNERDFALELGAVWAGDTEEKAPEKLDAIIDTTPVWKPVVEALNNLNKGGRLVINAIRKENVDKDYLQKLSYPNHLWLEKEIKSVANITARDVREFLDLAAKAQILPDYQEYPLEDANKALLEMKNQKIHGAKVLRIG